MYHLRAVVSVPGVVLGGSLIMFACFLGNECDVRVRPAASGGSSDAGLGGALHRTKFGGGGGVGLDARPPVATSYSYGWSFALAVLAFLASEASAVLCFTAFIRRFDSEVRTYVGKVKRERRSESRRPRLRPEITLVTIDGAYLAPSNPSMGKNSQVFHNLRRVY